MPDVPVNRPTVSLALSLAAFAAACGNDPNTGTDTGPTPDVGDVYVDVPLDVSPDAPTRPANATCFVPDRPTGELPIALEPAFGDLRWDQPIAAHQAPGDNESWYVVERGGRIERVRDGAAELFLDISDRADDSASESGLLGLAFAPDYADSGVFYVSYTASGFQSRISRMRPTDDGFAEDILLRLDQPAGNHNGGDIHFGPDGHLYIAFGDGGGGDDQFGHGQRSDTLFGTILRIDVTTVGGAPYQIPDDNPFLDGGGAPEVFAYGLRNPWRFSFDRVSGDLWAGDVGQRLWEEVDVITAGGNYGWPIREGFECFLDDPRCGDDDTVRPVVAYDHSEGISITGGFVYRGDAIPALYGVYLFADFGSGRIWGVFENAETGEPERRQLLDTSLSIASFAEGHDGELFVIDYFGSLHRIVEAPAADTIPELLSETGCFDPATPLDPSPALIPFAPIAPFWSDNAEKFRWFALPDDATIAVGADGDFDLPIGSVTVKHFMLGDRHIETRLMYRHDDGGWSGYSYAWNADQTDAVLVADGDSRDIDGQTWRFPSSTECLACHTEAAGRTLGLETDQLDHPLAYSDSYTGNQLDTLAAMGVLAGRPRSDNPLVSPSDDSRTFTERAYAYLHTNCAFCHQADGPARAEFDVRWRTEQTGICEAAPLNMLGIEDARLFASGDVERSLIHNRMNRRDELAMPPLASNLVDTEGAQLLEMFINGDATVCR